MKLSFENLNFDHRANVILWWLLNIVEWQESSVFFFFLRVEVQKYPFVLGHTRPFSKKIKIKIKINFLGDFMLFFFFFQVPQKVQIIGLKIR